MICCVVPYNSLSGPQGHELRMGIEYDICFSRPVGGDVEVLLCSVTLFAGFNPASGYLEFRSSGNWGTMQGKRTT